MSKRALTFLAAIVFGLGACVTVPPTPSPAPPTPVHQPTVPGKAGKLRVAFAATPGLADIPFWIAADALKQQGYGVEEPQYARYDLLTAALISGEVDIASSSHQTTWAAIAKGAPIHAIVGRLGMMSAVVAKSEIKTCSDLQGRSIAYSATTGSLAAMADRYLKQSCPGTQPQITTIPSSRNRMAALLSSAVDAAILEEEDALELERQAPGKFHILSRFAEEFPLLDYSAFYVRNDFAAQHPDIVKDFVMGVVEAVRGVQDPQVLREAIQRYLPDDASALANADAYLAHKAWDVNGGLLPEHILYTLTFLTDAGMVPAGLEMEQLVDLSYLNAVLDEIGKQ